MKSTSTSNINWRENYDRETTDYILSLIRAGVFSVDEEGRVWRLEVIRKGQTKPCLPRRAENKGDSGYYRIVIRIPGSKIRSVAAHRIVWEYSNGPIPNGLEINHKDRIRTNNRLSNLELVTHQENILHSYRNGRVSAQTRKSSLAQEHKLNICREYQHGTPPSLLAQRYGLKTSYVRYILYKNRQIQAA